MTRRCNIKRLLALAMLVVLLFTGTATAATRYATLEFGSRGSDVLKLQKALLALGYDPNGTDGKFGRGTENAVKQYQAANGLVADGKAGNLTLTRLYHGESVSANGGSSSGAVGSTGSSSSGNTTTSTNPNTLKYGDSGSRVSELQAALLKLGFDPNGVDGRFGAGTQRAVINFQKANGLTADGLAGSRTLQLIDQKLAALGSGSSSSGNTSSGSSSSGSSSSSGTSGLNRTLRNGYTGSDVLTVQTRLKELGYYTGSLDGVYGSGSIAAVKNFQQRNGLTADGLAGTRTFAVLFSSSVVAAGSSSGSPSSGSTSDNSSSSGSTSGDSSSSSNGYTTLRYGDKGDAVKQMQKALKELKYNVSPDGDYGALTQAAVAAFQRRNGLTADGVAGPKTLEVLYSGNAKEADPNADSGMALPEGTGSASGPSTSSVKLLHWFNDVKPTIRAGQTVTIFDPATNLQWTLRLYSLGRHADSEPLTLTDTQIMYKAFGNTNTWTPKPVYVKLPSGTWTLASMHNVPHLSGSIKDNGFDGHLCVHFLRDMDECSKNDPNYGVQNQNAIRKKWKQMTGITVD
ncbi:MAG: peptidoglycan-binding protein [Clostridiales bacterium]|nr:peptidoglycan-binding protein [Clostridiales bacterium]